MRKQQRMTMEQLSHLLRLHFLFRDCVYLTRKRCFSARIALTHLVLWGACCLGALCPAEAEAGFGFQNVVAMANELAREPFDDGKGEVPDFLVNLDYDSWRDIRFKPEHALWINEKRPFTVQFFHPGLFYDRPVKINVIESPGIRQVRFSPDLFTYGKNTFQEKVPPDLGFAGFRLHAPINMFLHCSPPHR